MYPEERPIIIDAIVSAIANFTLMIPLKRTNPSGLMSGEDVRNAMTGPHGSAVVSMPMMTPIVPHAHKGVKAPKRTLAHIEILGLLSRVFFSFS